MAPRKNASPHLAHVERDSNGEIMKPWICKYCKFVFSNATSTTSLKHHMEIRHPGLANLSLTEEENEKAYIAYLTWATKTHQPLQQCADNHFRNMLSKLTKDQFAVGCVKTYIKRLEIVYRQEQEKKITELQRTPGKVSYTSDLLYGPTRKCVISRLSPRIGSTKIGLFRAPFWTLSR